MAFESLKQAAPSVDQMLVRYEERAQKGLVERTEMDRSFALVEKALRSVKGRLQDPQFLQSLNADEIQKLSNAWTAWGNEKFIPDAALRRELASVLIEDKANPRRDRALTYARQIWRTEMSATVVRDLTKDASRTDADKSTVLEKIMAGQIVKELEDSPVEALRVSMHLDGALNNMAVRQQLATEMEASQINGLGAWGPLDKVLAQQGKRVERFRVVVGGDLLDVPANMRESLNLKHVVIHGDRSYAQMENGCRGNLVIIDLTPGESPVEPGQGPGPGPGPDGDGSNEPPNNLNLPKDYIGVHTKNGVLVPSAEQFNEHIDAALVSGELIHQYTTLGIEPFLEGMKAIPVAQQQLILNNVFDKIGEHDPTLAQHLLQEIIQNRAHVLRAGVLAEMDDNIAAAPNADVKSFWELQKALLTGQHENGDPTEMKGLMELLDKVNAVNLPPDLKDMYESNKRSVEFFVRRPLALDMVETSIRVAKETLSTEDQKDLQELVAKSPSEIAEELNSGLDNDEETYLSSMHVMEALRLALMYQYPKDMMAGNDIQSPVQHYYDLIKNGTLDHIDIPAPTPGSGYVEQLDDPRGGLPFPSGGTVDFRTLFVDRAKEMDLFEQYQSGDETLSTNSWTSVIGSELSKVPLMGGGSDAFIGGFGGLVKGSDHLFKQNLFEKGGNLGAVENLYVEKIQTLQRLGRYDEARELCVQVLNDKLNAKKKIDPTDLDVTKRADKLAEDYMSKISAQVLQELAAQGINSSAQVVGIPRLNGSGTYTNLNDFITDRARSILEKRAYLELKGEVGEQIFDDNDGKLPGATPLEAVAFNNLADLNGYGKLDISEEKADLVQDVSKTLAEILIIEVATAGLGSFAAGAVGAGEVGGIGSRAFSIARTTGMTDRAYTLGRGFGAMSRMDRLTPWLTGGRLAAADTITGGRLGLAARNVGHATTFLEAQHLMNGDTLHPIDDFPETAYEVGTMAVTLYGLGKAQQLLRGETAGALRVANGTAFTGPLRDIPNRNPFTMLDRGFDKLGLSRLSRAAGDFNTRISESGLPGRIAMGTGEYVSEVTALHFLSKAELWSANGLGLISNTQYEAMQEPETLRTWAQEAGVVLGLRGFAMARTGDGRYRGTPGEKTPINRPDPIIPGTQVPMVYQEPVLEGTLEPPRVQPRNIIDGELDIDPPKQIGMTPEVRRGERTVVREPVDSVPPIAPGDQVPMLWTRPEQLSQGPGDQVPLRNTNFDASELRPNEGPQFPLEAFGDPNETIGERPKAPTVDDAARLRAHQPEADALMAAANNLRSTAEPSGREGAPRSSDAPSGEEGVNL